MFGILLHDHSSTTTAPFSVVSTQISARPSPRVFGVSPAIDLDGMRIDENSPAFDQLDPAVLQHVAIDLREALDLAVFGLDQGGPVKARYRHRPAKPGGIGKRIGKLRAVDKQLLRNA